MKTSQPRPTDPTMPPPSLDCIAPKLLLRIDAERLALLHVADMHAELSDELVRAPQLRELSHALFARRHVDRSRRKLARDLEVLDLPRTTTGRRRRAEGDDESPRRVVLPSDEKLSRTKVKDLIRMVRQAHWFGDEEAFRKVLALVPEHRRKVLACCLARPTRWKS